MIYHIIGRSLDRLIMAAAATTTTAPASGTDPQCSRFAGKVALVTGAAGDIGTAIAERLAAEGASLLLIDIRKEPLDTVAAKIKAIADANGGVVQTCVADVTDKTAVAAYVAQGEAMGGINCFFNNAGKHGC
jgi:NADP-dependent 3-hydroxy acid dehydrogenase YdfG